MSTPYTEKVISENVKLRHFSAETNPDDLKWHYDKEDRLIWVVGENDWKFQFDNKLPIPLNQKIIIPIGVMHRLIKGTGDLNIMIKSITL